MARNLKSIQFRADFEIAIQKHWTARTGAEIQLPTEHHGRRLMGSVLRRIATAIESGENGEKLGLGAGFYERPGLWIVKVRKA